MISDELLTQYSYAVSSRFEAINSHYIKLMGEQIREIGQLSPSNLHRLNQMTRMGQNVDEIQNLLSAESGRTLAELQQIYQISGMSVYQDAAKYYLAKGVPQVPFAENEAIQKYLSVLGRRTGNTFANISQTTALRKEYQRMVDTAIDAVANGVGDYNSLIRMQFGDLLSSGIQVEYATKLKNGEHLKRRLDSAVRMNVLEGVRQMNNGVRMITAEEFGADGVEISAHALCAEDHIDIQGQQYALGDKDVMVDGVLYESFEQLNASLDRPISTLNCKHIIFPIVLGISTPAYSDEELQAYKDNSEEEYAIPWGFNKDGSPKMKTITKYGATQLMRQIETAMRYSKDDYISAEAMGDEAEMREAEKRLGVYSRKYNDICQRVGLEPKLDRAYVPGYKGIGNPKPDDIVLKPISKTVISQVEEVPVSNTEKLTEIMKEGYNNKTTRFDLELSKFEELGDVVTGFEKLPEDVQQLWMDTIQRLNDEYYGGWDLIEVDNSNMLERGSAYTTMNNTFGTSQLTINPSIYKKLVEGANIESYIIHEYAHTFLDVQSTISPGHRNNVVELKSMQKELRALYKNYMGDLEKYAKLIDSLGKDYEKLFEELDDLDKLTEIGDKLKEANKYFESIQISEYSKTNVDEFMAEAFADAMSSDNPSDYSLKVKSIIDKYFKK